MRIDNELAQAQEELEALRRIMTGGDAQLELETKARKRGSLSVDSSQFFPRAKADSLVAFLTRYRMAFMIIIGIFVVMGLGAPLAAKLIHLRKRGFVPKIAPRLKKTAAASAIFNPKNLADVLKDQNAKLKSRKERGLLD